MYVTADMCTSMPSSCACSRRVCLRCLRFVNIIQIESIWHYVLLFNSLNTLSTKPVFSVDDTSKPSLVGKYEPIKIIKEKFPNILYKSAYTSGQEKNKFNLFNEQSPNNFKFLSENLKNSVSLNKKDFFVSTNFNFNRPLLLFDTNRFSYQKLGYFFKVNLPLSIHQLHFKKVDYNTNFINEKDNFFIPVNLNSHNKLFKMDFFNNLDSSLSSSVKI